MLSVEDIRTYAKDTPEYNVLLEGEYQSVKKLVELAMKLRACLETHLSIMKRFNSMLAMAI